jgi:hypothetical protein
LSLNLGGATTKVNHTSTILIMPRIQEKIKRYFCAATVDASLLASLHAICSGSIAQILSFNTIHTFQEPAKPCDNSILPQSPQNTQHDRGLFGASFGTVGGLL